MLSGLQPCFVVLLVLLQIVPTAALAANETAWGTPPGEMPADSRLNPFRSRPVVAIQASTASPQLAPPEPMPLPGTSTLEEMLESEENKAMLVEVLREYLDLEGDSNATADMETADMETEGVEPDKPSDTGFDQAVVRQGEQFFESSCTQCHDAERSTSKMKTYPAWLATVRRMAAKEDADVASGEHTAIATYLASLDPANQPTQSKASRGGPAAKESLPAMTFNGTLSPAWRGTDPQVENKGFFPDVWLGAEWRPENNPFSASVMACASCHGTNGGLGVELAEASLTVDLYQLLARRSPEQRNCSRSEARLKAGRFIVPFGATSSRVHPGAQRTVSLPLMFNMGRRVGSTGPQQPVLPLPYSDEGVQLHLSRELGKGTVTFDTYAVNGLQQGGSTTFLFSRSYRDNNSNVAVGARATYALGDWKIGGSLTAGELQKEGAPLQSYKLSGADLSYRCGEKFRAYYEYAIRVEDSFSFANSESIVYGNLLEMEMLLLSDPKMSLLARYDTLEHRGFFGEAGIQRLTYGLNFGLRGGSFLAINHEHWMFDNAHSVNIMGVRWTMAF